LTTKHKWSQHVTETSDARDLENGVFVQDDPKSIARSLKRSAEHSSRRKTSPFASAMSMITFFMNRAGRNLDPQRRRVLEEAKEELRRAFDRD
jgi:hypothetical protein